MTPPLPPFCLYINLINCGRNWSLNLAGFSRFLGVFQLWLGHCTSKKPVRGKHCDSSFPDHSPDVFMFLTLCAWRAADMSPAFCFLLGKLASWPYFLIEFCLPRSVPYEYSTFCSPWLTFCSFPPLPDPWQDKSPTKTVWELLRVSSSLKYPLFKSYYICSAVSFF